MTNPTMVLLLLMAFYSALGWVLEVVYYTTLTGHFINRGFLNGPICPVYGFAFLTFVGLFQSIDNWIILFFTSMLIATTVEFITGYLLERIFNDKWWDYSDEPFNIMGYICLKFSLMWGFACTFAVKIIHPVLVRFFSGLPFELSFALIIIIYTIAFSDLVVTVAALRKLQIQFSALNEIVERMRKISDFVGEEISEKTIDVLEKTEKGKEELEELKAKLAEIRLSRSPVQKRLMLAFPRLNLQERLNSGRNLIKKIKSKIIKE